MSNNPAQTFDASTSQGNVDYARVAEQVKNLKPGALMPTQYDDVITLIEWMQGEVLKAHERNIRKQEHLDQRDAEICKRERDVAIRSRTVHAAAGFKPAKRAFWR